MHQDTIVATPIPSTVDTVVAQPPSPRVAPAVKDSVPRQPSDTASVRPVVHRDTVAVVPIDTVARATEKEADTVVIPDSLPLLYLGAAEPDSLLARDSLLFSGVSGNGGAYGMYAERLPAALHRNDGVTAVLLCCFALTMLLIRSSRQRLRQRLKDFFVPSSTPTTALPDDESSEFVHLFLGLQLSLLVAVLFSFYAEAHLPLVSISLRPLQLLGIYALVTFIILVLKQALYALVHSVFFTPSQRRLWRRRFALLFAAESLLLLPIALLSVYFDLTTHSAAILVAILLIFIKFLFTLKCFEAFFPKFYGILHLIAYLCALEIAPIVLLWSALVALTNTLTVI